MKKRKMRERLRGTPMEWPKTLHRTLLSEVDGLSGDTVVHVVCQWDAASSPDVAATLSMARKIAREKEYSWAPITRFTFMVRATLRFVQCLLQQSVQALRIQCVGRSVLAG